MRSSNWVVHGALSFRLNSIAITNDKYFVGQRSGRIIVVAAAAGFASATAAIIISIIIMMMMIYEPLLLD